MTVQIADRHIEKAIARFEARSRKPAARSGSGISARIITISREYGTEGRAIAEAVSKRLDFSLWDREILDVLAGQSGWKLQARMFEALDEKAQGAIEALVADFFGGVEKHNYFHLLPKAICTIAQENAVIVGRGAHLIVPHAFRVRIEASASTRIRALAALEDITERSARQKIIRIDKERAGFIRQLASLVGAHTDSLDYDLRINTDRISSKNAAQSVIESFERFVKETR